MGSDSGGWSETQSFANPDFESSDEITAFMFGDMGVATPYRTFIRTQDESLSTVKWILRDVRGLGSGKASMVSHIGDISYARGYAWVWDEFFRQVEPIASRVPYHVCVGNHEYDWPAQPWRPEWARPIYGRDSGGECGVPYSLRFHMPEASPEPAGARAPPTRNLYYSLDLGPVHFVYFSTETDFLPGSEQREFLVRDLGSVDRTRRPFVVVQGHRPMYTTSSNLRDAPFTTRLRESLEPVFVENRVTLALWGHVHRYERFCPMSNFTCGEGLPVHAVIGMAGQDWQPIWEPRPDHPDLPVFPQPERSVYRGGEFGYTRLVATREKLTFSYVGNHDGEVHDQVVILASGRVVNGDEDIVGDGDGNEAEEVESTFPVFVKIGSLLLIGAFLGYVIGYLSHARKRSAPANNWTPVKSEET